ncbi:MAG TPA: hypothetical protein VEW95_01520 [Candidatus Limnocylindrales bacterium]|nr:hypothetical protein [Candidatus Limnocylindrales bacterium]
MRVIRPAALAPHRRRRALVLALSMLAIGALAFELVLVGSGATVAVIGVLASVAALGLGIGAAWLARVVSPSRMQSAAELLESLLSPVFDDAYTLVLSPRLPIRDAARLDGLLIGPAGVRAMTVRDWEGRYRVRGRQWEFHAGRGRGWIRCRTNPSFDAVTLGEGVGRWAVEAGLPHVPVRGAVAFPLKRSRIALEEPEDEIVTADNGPWWGNAIGRARRLDQATGAGFLAAVLDAADTQPTESAPTAAARR